MTIVVTQSGLASETARGKYTVIVRLSADETEEHTEIRTFTVFRYFQKEIPPTGAFLSKEQFDALDEAAQATDAVLASVAFLAYGDNTVKRLKEKLKRKGFSPAACDRAAAFLTEKGYINEEEQLKRLMTMLCEKKRYGLRRIRAEVWQKGFSDAAIAAVWEETAAALDFGAALDKRLSALPENAFSDPKSRQRHYAALMRYGFSAEEIGRAVKRNF